MPCWQYSVIEEDMLQGYAFAFLQLSTLGWLILLGGTGLLRTSTGSFSIWSFVVLNSLEAEEVRVCDRETLH